MNIRNITLFSINKCIDHPTQYINVNEGNYEKALVTYFEISEEEFFKNLMIQRGFLYRNRTSLYILRDSNHFELKRMLKNIEGFNVNVVRGGGSKSHLISPIDFRLSMYIAAIFNLNFKRASYFNDFNFLSKSRYLPFFPKKK
jgi:hypothetical protein